MSKAKATTGPKDHVTVLDQSCTRIDALHTQVSSTGLFNLVWTGKWPDFKPSNRIVQIEEELTTTDGIITEANSHALKIMQNSTRLREAALALSVLVGKKMQEEFKTVERDISGLGPSLINVRVLTDEEYEKLNQYTVSWDRFEAIRKRLDEMATKANELAENAKLASEVLESTKLISSFWEENKDQMKNVQNLFQEKLRQKKEEIARLEEERKAEERERKEQEQAEWDRQERERKEREEMERLEREERERLERLEKERLEEERKAKEREREEREKPERERREREQKEREEKERLEREERERLERERLAREEQERLEIERREKEEMERKAREEKERKELERKEREARRKAEQEERKQKKKEEEEQRRRLEEQTRREEEAERARRDPNSKFWRSLLCTTALCIGLTAFLFFWTTINTNGVPLLHRLEEERKAKERVRKEQEKEARERREREKKEREKRERAEREERERLERLEKERLEEERKAKERERKEREKAERERREREKKEREEKERLEREERERLERERLAREEQERLERERQEKEERERKAREEKERKERERKDKEAREKAEREERKRKKKEEEEQRRRLEEQRRREEEAERERRDPNSKFWRSLHYNAQEETKQNKGLCCVFRAFTDSLVRSEISVAEVPFVRANVTIGSGEELASSVLDIRSENGRLEYPYPARLAMPNLVGRHHFYTAIAKVRVDDSSEWTTVPSKDTNIEKYKDLAECELPPFTRIRLAILRAVPKDSKVIRRGGGTVRSNIEPRISIEFPKDAVQDPREITLLIRHVDHQLIETLKRHSQGCDNVTTASHVLHVENMEDLGRLRVPLKVTMPAVDRLKKNKQDKTPPMYTLVIQLSPNGQWTICRKVDTEPNEEGVVTVMSSNPVSGMVVMGMATNSEAEAEFAAERLNRHLDEHVIKFIQRQSEKDRSQIVTDCFNTEDSDDRLSDLEKKGYTVGPSPSKEILIREGQAFKMMLSQRGNLRRTGFGKDTADGVIEFVYHSKIKCSKEEFSVEPDNIYAQSSRDFYFGHNEYFTQSSSGTKAEKIHDFEIKLPRRNRERFRARARALGMGRFGAGALGEEIFKLIAASLEEGEWTQLASRLKMDKAKIARIEKDNSGKGLEQTVFAILWDWYKKTEVSGNKVENLCHSLRKINKDDIAYHIEQENNKIMEDRKNKAKDTNLTKAFFIVKESETVLRNWKMIGHHLGVSEGDVAAIDIDANDEVDGVKEKVWKVLNAWKDQDVGGATMDKLIAVMRKMGITMVAEKLERLIPMSDRNTAGPSRPTTARRPKTAAGRSNSGLSPRGIVSRPSTVHGSRR